MLDARLARGPLDRQACGPLNHYAREPLDS